MNAHPFGFGVPVFYGAHVRHEDDQMGDELGGGAAFGAPPTWFSALVSLVPGGQNKINEFENYIRTTAREGAEAAIPEIRSEVTKTAKPFVIGAAVLGLGGFLFGLGAWRATRGGR